MREPPSHNYPRSLSETFINSGKIDRYKKRDFKVKTHMWNVFMTVFLPVLSSNVVVNIITFFNF